MSRGGAAPGGKRSVYAHDEGTFDNGATISQMRFLARSYAATSDARYRDAFLRGVDYVLKAQYPSGGWPQVFPLAGGYHDYVTFNDHAMTRVMQLSADLLARRKGFDIVDPERRVKLAQAFDKGLDYILRSQIKVNGELTAWCQQHDPVTYEPRPGRAYEHASIASSESAEVLAFLLSLPPRTPAVERAIEAGAKWLRQVRIVGYRSDRAKEQALMPDRGAHVWARFYEIGTNRPIFSDRDGIIKYSIEEIGRERRTGYAWYATAPDKVLALLARRGAGTVPPWTVPSRGYSPGFPWPGRPSGKPGQSHPERTAPLGRGESARS